MKTLSDDVLQRISDIIQLPVNVLMYSDLSHLKKMKQKWIRSFLLMSFLIL